MGMTNRSRRWALAACLGAPLVGAAALSGRVRTALVGARGFTDSWAAPRRLPEDAARAGRRERMLPGPPRGSPRPISAPTSYWRRWSRPSGSSACPPTPTIRRPRTATTSTRRSIPRLRTDPETIIALAPDLVCVAGFTAADPLRLLVGRRPDRRALVAVRFVRGRHGRDSAPRGGGRRGRARGSAGGQHRGAARRSRTAAGAACRPVRVLYYDPPTYTMGRGTLVDEILTRAGGDERRATSSGIVGPGQIGLETVLALEPEAIIMPNYADNTSVLRALGARRDLAPGPGRPRRPRPRDSRRVDRDGVTPRRPGPGARRPRSPPRGLRRSAAAACTADG